MNITAGALLHADTAEHGTGISFSSPLELTEVTGRALLRVRAARHGDGRFTSFVENIKRKDREDEHDWQACVMVPTVYEAQTDPRSRILSGNLWVDVQ